MYLNGRYGQISGTTIPAGQDLLAEGGLISEQTPETTAPILSHIGILAPPGTVVIINGMEAKITRAGVLELENSVSIRSLIFPNGASNQVTIDYIY